jgi:GAF domain-containing protein
VTQSDDARQESDVRREPAATLNAAILRINATLDLDTVLGEAVASARTLTGARYGTIVTVDEEGVPLNPVFSGLAPEEEREQLAWPGNAQLFEHLRALPGPLRSTDFPVYVRDLGIDAPW